MIFHSYNESETATLPVIIDHNCTKLDKIPVEWINQAKTNLHIAYGHTSHGSQLIDGMTRLENWQVEPYLWNNELLDGSLDRRDKIMIGDLG